MAFSTNGKFGFRAIDGVTGSAATWYELAKAGNGIAGTVEIKAVCVNTTGGQRIYIGFLPNGGTDPTNLSTIGDLEYQEYYVKLQAGTPFILNAQALSNEEEIWVYSDAVDVHFSARGLVRSEA